MVEGKDSDRIVVGEHQEYSQRMSLASHGVIVSTSERPRGHGHDRLTCRWIKWMRVEKWEEEGEDARRGRGICERRVLHRPQTSCNFAQNKHLSFQRVLRLN